MTPLVAGGSLAGILDWRRRLSDTPKQSHRFSRLHLGGRAHDDGDGSEPAGNLEEDEIKAVTKQVLEGLHYLHDNGYLHVSAAPPVDRTVRKVLTANVARFESGQFAH